MEQLINSFPGYEYKFIDDSNDNKKHNIYMGTDVGKGGYVYAEPGMYTNVALLDIASLHPHSILALNKFGEYTARYKEILEARLAIKHHDYDSAKKMLNGMLEPFLNDEDEADQLAKALKLILNSTYGFCSATFPNPFADPRDDNNIVALRGALFMRTLQDEVEKRGFTVAHIKTDSIKIPNATPEIIQFCMDFAKKYGYTFEHEATYEKMCLVNDAVYIAKYSDDEQVNEKHAGEWTATGTQFAVPYVFKTLFSKEPIEFNDLCETKSVKSALYLDINEDLPDVSDLEKELAKIETKYKKQQISDDEYQSYCSDLVPEIAKGHDYQFIGKVGQFCPILPGHGGGILVRDQNGKMYNVTGTSGYRWLESEMVRGVNEEYIDKSYYNALVDDAIETISQYGDFEMFVGD